MTDEIEEIGEVASEAIFYDAVYGGQKEVVSAWNDPQILQCLHPLSREHVRRNIERYIGHRVLDLCCGKGISTFDRFATLRRLPVTGLDVSSIGLHQLRKKAANYMVIQADAHSPPFSDEVFDTILVYAALHHLKAAKVIPELHRLLCPGGRVILYEPLRGNLPRRMLYQVAREPKRYLISRFALKVLGISSDRIGLSPLEQPFRLSELLELIEVHLEIEEMYAFDLLQSTLGHLLSLVPVTLLKGLLVWILGVYCHLEDHLVRKFPFLGRHGSVIMIVAKKV